jgi:hypothetical protein
MESFFQDGSHVAYSQEVNNVAFSQEGNVARNIQKI